MALAFAPATSFGWGNTGREAVVEVALQFDPTLRARIDAVMSGHQRDCILMQGSEFKKVVDCEIWWPQALRLVIDNASVHGNVLVNLRGGD